MLIRDHIDEPGTYIKSVKTGSSSEEIVIIVSQSVDVDTIFIWDTKHNIEAHVFDSYEKYQIMWDMYGVA